MAEPAENLSPEPIPSEPAAQSAQAPAQAPNVSFGTFLQFGKKEFRNVTVAGIDPASGNVLAYRRDGDQIKRVLIPMQDYEESLKMQKAVEKRTGRKQKAFLGRFVGSLLNRSIVHDGQPAQVVGYDAQRGEALTMVNGSPQWIGAPALLESQKNISLVKQTKQTGQTKSDEDFLNTAKRFAKRFEQAEDKVQFEQVFTKSGKSDYAKRLDSFEKALKTGEPEEILKTRQALEEWSALAKKQTLSDSKHILEAADTPERKKTTQDFLNQLNKVDNLTDFEKKIGEYVEQKKVVVAKEQEEALTQEEIKQAEAEADEPEITIEELSEEEAEQITAEAEAAELVEAVKNAKVVEALAGASIANVLPAALVQTLSVPVTPGSVAEKRRDLQIEQAYQQFAKGKSPEDLAKVLGGLTQEFRQIDASKLPEMQPLREIQAKLVSAAATDLKSKGVLLPEISVRLTGDSLQTARDLATTIEISGGVPVAPVMPAVAIAATIAVGAVPAAAGAAVTQAAVLSQAQAAVNILGQQISDRSAAAEQIRSNIGQIGNRINELNQRMTSMPQGNDRTMIEGQISSAEGQRRSLQDQLTTATVQLGNDKREQGALQVGIANISQAPSGQAPPGLVIDLQNKIPARLAPQIAALPVLPAVSGAAPTIAAAAPAVSVAPTIAIGAPTAQPSPVKIAPIRAVGQAPSTPVRQAGPAPARIPSGPVQAVRAPLRALPGGGRDTQRAAQLVADQQAGLLGEEEEYLPEEGVSDTYEQALAGEGAVGGELSPLEAGTQLPDTSMTYAAGGNVEEGPEPGDMFMEREAAGRRRMANLNKQAPSRPAGEAPPLTARPTGAAPGAAGAPQAPTAREASLTQRLLNAQSQAFLKRDKSQGGLEKLQAAQNVQANLDSIKKLKRLYDVAKVGSALTFWGIVLAILTMNIQTINKYTTKIRVIPAPTFVEDVLIVILDLMLIQVLVVTTAVLLIVPAIIAAVVGGLLVGAGELGVFDWIEAVFNVVTS